MNKWVKAGLIAALAGMTLVYGGCGGNSAGSSKTSGKKQVAVVQIMQHGSLDAANQGMIDGLKDKGYGPDKVEVDQQNAQGDQSNLKSITARFKSNKPDIILGSLLRQRRQSQMRSKIFRSSAVPSPTLRRRSSSNRIRSRKRMSPASMTVVRSKSRSIWAKSSCRMPRPWGFSTARVK